MQTAINQIKSKIPLLNSVLDTEMANFWLQRFNPIWSVGQALGKVVDIDRRVAAMTSLTIQVNRHFQFGRAGQHHPVIVEIHGRRYERSYSLTQLDNQRVLLSVKNVTDGVVSNYLNQHLALGEILEFGQPYGDMCLPEQTDALLLIAAGSGITPMYSLIEQWVKTGGPYPVQLLYWVKKHEEAAFKTRLEQLQQQYPKLKVQIFYTQEQPADVRIGAAHLSQFTNLSKSTVYACGPSAFVTTAQTLSDSAKLFKGEAFSLSTDLQEQTGTVQITLSKSNTTVNIAKGQSILVGLEQQNIKPEHGCRMGICNKCVCQKVQGSSRNLVDGSENHEPRNMLKLCVNTAQTDLIIDL